MNNYILISKEILRLIVVSLLLLGHQHLRSQNPLNLMQMKCEGPVPDDFIKSLSDFVGNESTGNKHSQKRLINIYEYFNSGNVIYGNSAANYVSSLGNKVLKANNLNLNIKFYLLRSSVYNAFATDEGYIFISTSLLSNSNTEDELAFVICHELSHVLLHHNTQSANFIDSTIFRTKKQRKSDNAPKNLEPLTLDKILRQYYAYSREHELEADSLGIVLFKNAGYNANMAVKALEGLQYDLPLYSSFKYNPAFIEPYFDDSILSILNQSCNRNKNLTLLSNINYSNKKNTNKETNEEYATHPGWQTRVKKASDYAQKLNTSSSNTSTPINNSLKLTFLSESMVQAIKTAEYINALMYLSELKSWGLNDSITDFFKGYILSSYYFTYLQKSNEIKYNKEIISDAKNLRSMGFHILSLDKQKLLKLAYYYLNRSLSNNYFARNLNFSVYSEISSINSLVKDSIVLEGCQSKKFLFSSNKKLNILLDSFIDVSKKPTSNVAAVPYIDKENYDDDVIFNVNYQNYSYKVKSEKTDTILLLAPDIKQYKLKNKYLFSYLNPFLANSNTEYLIEELKKYSKDQNIHYIVVDFNDKKHLTTESYNNSYLINSLLQELSFKSSLNKQIPVLSSLNNELGNLKTNKIQLIGGKAYKAKPKVLALIFVDPFSSLFELVGFGKEESYYEVMQPVNTYYNVILDLKSYSVEYIAIYETTQKLNKSSMSALSMKLLTHTKEHLKK